MSIQTMTMMSVDGSCSYQLSNTCCNRDSNFSKKAKRGTRHKDLPTDEYEQAIMHAQESGKGVWVEATATTSGARPNFASKKDQPTNVNKKKAKDVDSVCYNFEQLFTMLLLINF